MCIGAVQRLVPGMGSNLDEPSRADDGQIEHIERLAEGAGWWLPTASLALHLLGLLQVASIERRRGLVGAAAGPPVNMSERTDRLRSVH